MIETNIKELQETEKFTLEILKYLTTEYYKQIPKQREYFFKKLDNEYKIIKEKGEINPENIFSIVQHLEKEITESPKQKNILTAIENIWTDYAKLFNIQRGTEIERLLKKTRENLLFSTDETEQKIAKDIRYMLEIKKQSEYTAGAVTDAIYEFLENETIPDDKNELYKKLLNKAIEKINTGNISKTDKQNAITLLKRQDFNEIADFFVLNDKEGEYEEFFRKYIKNSAEPKKEFLLKQYFLSSKMFEKETERIFEESFYKENFIHNFNDFVKKYISPEKENPIEEMFLKKEINKNEKFIKELENFQKAVKSIRRKQPIPPEAKIAFDNIFGITDGSNAKKIYNIFDNYSSFKNDLKRNSLFYENGAEDLSANIDLFNDNTVIDNAIHIFLGKDLKRNQDGSENENLFFKRGGLNFIPFSNSKKAFLECMKTAGVKARMYDTNISNTEQCIDKYIQNIKKETENLERILNNREMSFVLYTTPLATFFMIYYMINLNREKNAEKKKLAFLEKIDRIQKLSKNVKNKTELKNLYKYLNILNGKKIDLSDPNFNNDKTLNTIVKFAIEDMSHFFKNKEFGENIKHFHDFLKEQYQKVAGEKENFTQTDCFFKYVEKMKNIQKEYFFDQRQSEMLNEINSLKEKLKEINSDIDIFLQNKDMKKLTEAIEKRSRIKEKYFNLAEKIHNNTDDLQILNEKLQEAYKNNDIKTIKEITKQIQEREFDIEKNVQEQIKNFDYVTNYQELEKTFNKLAKYIYKQDFENNSVKDKQFLRYKTQFELLMEQEKELKSKIVQTIDELNSKNTIKNRIKLQYYASTYEATVNTINKNIQKAKEYFTKTYSVEYDKNTNNMKYYKNDGNNRKEINDKDIIMQIKMFKTFLNENIDGNFYKNIDNSIFQGQKGIKNLENLLNYTNNLNDEVFKHIYEHTKPIHIKEIKVLSPERFSIRSFRKQKR